MENENISHDPREKSIGTPIAARENSNSDLRSLLKLDFDGRAKIKIEGGSSQTANSELIQSLNLYSTEITDEIKNEVKAKIPVGLDVTVEIDFKSGSIAFEGFITITDFLSKLDGTVGGAKILIDAVRLVINKVIRKRIEEKGGATVRDIRTNVTISKAEKDAIHPITRFMWWCGGAAVDILRDSPTDKVKYQTIGAAVFTTGLLAFLSGGYALYTMFDGTTHAWGLGIVFGLIWGAIIFNMNWLQVSALTKLSEIDEAEGNEFESEMTFLLGFIT